MAIRPTVPPRPSPGPRPGRGPGSPGGNRPGSPTNRPGPAGPSPSGVRQVPPSPPPTTPFQPGAPPSPPLNPILAGLGLLAAAGQALWGLLNQRGPIREVEPADGTEFVFSGGDVFRILRWKNRTVQRNRFSCNTGQSFNDTNPTPDESGPFFGNWSRLTIGTTAATNSNVCGSGTNTPSTQVPIYQVRRADGTLIDQFTAGAGGVTFVGLETAATVTFEASDFRVQTGSTTESLKQRVRDPLPAAVAPRLSGDLPEAEPDQQPAAPPLPLLPVSPPAPAVAPQFPRPTPAPGGSPGRAPGRAPGSAPAPAPLPGPSTPPALPQAPPITAGGVQPQLPPAPQITAPGTTFLPGGRPLVPNGPAPTMQSIATELGKLEQKLEILLNPQDDLSPLDLLNRVIDQVENIEFLIEQLFPPGPYTFEAGAYQLAPVCDRDAEGELVPPLEAPWAGGEGEFNELRQRLDALALLIQHHKTLKQPTCGGIGITPPGNVTVMFESD